MATNAMANIKETIVLDENASPNMSQVRIAKTIIPKANPTNLPGHNNPPKPATIYLVDSINRYDTGAPSSANNIGLSENHFHINCPLI